MPGEGELKTGRKTVYSNTLKELSLTNSSAHKQKLKSVNGSLNGGIDRTAGQQQLDVRFSKIWFLEGAWPSGGAVRNAKVLPWQRA